jgi:nicotinate dehydrogenase subunit A
MAEEFTFTVDGATRTIMVDDPAMPLLYALRDELQLNNPRFGCGLGQCGACTVHVDGRAIRSCVTPVVTVANRNITTIAGLGSPENPHPIQTAWIEEEVNQCAYCINGWIMTAAELMANNPRPTEQEIRTAFGELICRCGSHAAAIRAVKRATGQV